MENQNKQTLFYQITEEKWLDRIEKYLVKEQFIDHESFNTGAFKNEGGYEKINKALKKSVR